jgi:hypothetical protein
MRSSSHAEEKLESHPEIARVSRAAGGWRIGERGPGGDRVRGSRDSLDGAYMEKEVWARYDFDPGSIEMVVQYDIELPTFEAKVAMIHNGRSGQGVWGSSKSRSGGSLEVARDEREAVLNQLRDLVASLVAREELAAVVQGLNPPGRPEHLLLAHAKLIARREVKTTAEDDTKR